MTSTKVAFVDLDGTLLKGFSQFYLINYYFVRKKVGLLDYISIIFWFLKHKLFSVSVDTVLMDKIYGKLIKGMAFEEGRIIIKDCFEKKMKADVNQSLIGRLNKLKEEGCSLVLVSASVEPVVEIFAHQYGFDHWIGTELELVGGYFTGRLVGKINEKEEKARRLKEIFSIEKIESFAFGDSLSDLPMLEMVDVPITVNPKPNLRKIALERGWEVFNTK